MNAQITLGVLAWWNNGRKAENRFWIKPPVLQSPFTSVILFLSFEMSKIWGACSANKTFPRQHSGWHGIMIWILTCLTDCITQLVSFHLLPPAICLLSALPCVAVTQETSCLAWLDGFELRSVDVNCNTLSNFNLVAGCKRCVLDLCTNAFVFRLFLWYWGRSLSWHTSGRSRFYWPTFRLNSLWFENEFADGWSGAVKGVNSVVEVWV